MSGQNLPPHIEKELDAYADWIKKYRLHQIGDIKMQKIRLQLGTYAQRQEGVQMQRIKFPGGKITADQLKTLADLADRYASGFIHLTTREDAQLYYVKLEDCPALMKELARVGITTREACGNTVRNITACYRSGVSANEVFDASPYAQVLFRFLVRNKFNQVMPRKFKIAFEGCAEDHAGVRFHDLGFQAVLREEGGKLRRGFRTYIGGSLGAVPYLGHLYTEFLPVEELFNLAAATVRLFDRYGERKNRMAARMKFLIRKWGWEKFKAALDVERAEVKLDPTLVGVIERAGDETPLPALPDELPQASLGTIESRAYKEWLRDSVLEHKYPGFKGVIVRIKLGDLLTDPARRLAEIARRFSQGELRITRHQNLFLPWVPEKALAALYQALAEINLVLPGAETLDDVTICPGADTCRLGLTSAKGLGSQIFNAWGNGLGQFKETCRGIQIKASGCPNSCAQHAVANIGFQGAALSKDGKTVPAYELFVGGEIAGEKTRVAERVGKFPARNGVKVVETLLALYVQERQQGESFSACMVRLGKERLRSALAPLAQIPSFHEDPEFYQDWGHENEKFAVRTGIKGECAGTVVQEKVPVMADARERLAQAEAFFAHKEYQYAQFEAYEAMAQAARVPLYAALCDPFTSEQALWEFENIFVRAGRVPDTWKNFADEVEKEKNAPPSESRAQSLINLARDFLVVCEEVFSQLQQAAAVKT